jgi:nucleoside-diphosphate-sugar epimerase
MKSSLRNKAVLVTGAAGFIGSHLAKRIHKEGVLVNAFLKEDINLFW